MRWLITILGLIASQLLWAQNFESIKTIWSGKDAWQQWDISETNGSGQLKTVWSDDPYHWQFSLPDDEGRITTTWTQDDSQWQLTSDKTQCQIKQKWSEDWHSWEISCDSTDINLRTTWSGDQAWDDWQATSSKGNIRIRTRWTNDWTDWDIDDNMQAPETEKFAAIFIAIYTAHKIAKSPKK